MEEKGGKNLMLVGPFERAGLYHGYIEFIEKYMVYII
jgi:hypothetical protein